MLPLIEIEPDRVGPGVDRRQRIVDVRDAANFDFEIHVLQYRGELNEFMLSRYSHSPPMPIQHDRDRRLRTRDDGDAIAGRRARRRLRLR